MIFGILVLGLMAFLWLWTRTRLPERPDLPPEVLALPEKTRLAGIWPDLSISGVLPLPDGIEAFATRLKLIEMAEHSIEVQYYLWRPDTCGSLMLEALHKAAERGVRVRLLIDDNATKPIDARIAWMNAHPRIEVRLFNPFPLRGMRLLGYAMDFRRLNRRMHNKALVVDGRAAVVGGRNVGDEYYNDLARMGTFMDFDALVMGRAACEAREEFETYWNSEPTWPADTILPDRLLEDTRTGAAQNAERVKSEDAQNFLALLAETPTTEELEAGRPNLREAEVKLLYDAPEKVLGRARRRNLLFPNMHMAMGTPTTRFDIISPYFVPRNAGRRQLIKLAKAGVKVRVLTNSLASSDKPIVHTGYSGQRRKLLSGGVEIYEFAHDEHVKFRRGLIGHHRRGTSPFARTKLHAKILSVDTEKVFIGTFNFDPRSLLLNTEMGIVIHDKDWAEHLHKGFESVIPAAAWKLTREHKRIRWERTTDQGTEIWHHEPYTSWWQRLLIVAGSFLPIEWLL
ncbi:phospholipase D family protein [Thioclava litoralis]|uniref:Phospholipase D n=1 Tax=Thioclava litoralis TaxID=3076557 RepID=A0ABZ1E1P1_9RHOB|nr:phospholipase D family protein [Thioclava sp. FTW29]